MSFCFKFLTDVKYEKFSDDVVSFKLSALTQSQCIVILDGKYRAKLLSRHFVQANI